MKKDIDYNYILKKETSISRILKNIFLVVFCIGIIIISIFLAFETKNGFGNEELLVDCFAILIIVVLIGFLCITFGIKPIIKYYKTKNMIKRGNKLVITLSKVTSTSTGSRTSTGESSTVDIEFENGISYEKQNGYDNLFGFKNDVNEGEVYYVVKLNNEVIDILDPNKYNYK